MDLSPLVKTVRVPLGERETFDLFTSGIGAWWPLATHSVGLDRAVDCAFEPRVGGRLFETLSDGSEKPWGVVTEWRPPRRLTFSWHPGRDAETAQEVEVSFAPEPGGGTLVRLEHRGWDLLGDEAEAMRGNYDGGWDGVLDQFVQVAEGAPV
ncbi:MAG: SRPBCC domain-containing protein [Gemmatimonadota bacterium]